MKEFNPYTTFIIEVKFGGRWVEVARSSGPNAYQKMKDLFENLNRSARLIEVLEET